MTLVRAKKHLGQHFLKDLSIAQRIADSLPEGCVLPVLEIGPGMGVLSQFLLQNHQITFNAVEIDRESVDYLHVKFPEMDVIEGDFLKMDLAPLFDGKPFAIIGNFPYNISSQIFFPRTRKSRSHSLRGRYDSKRSSRTHCSATRQ